MMYIVSDSDILRGAPDWLAAYFEYHAEQEQIARAEGRVEDEGEHHKAVVLLIRAMTAEQVPT